MQWRNILLFRMWLRILAVLGPFLIVSISFFTWAFWNNLTVRRYEVAAEGLTGRVRIAVLADFHNSSFGAALTDALAEAAPDIVVIPGDLDDSGIQNENARALLTAIGTEYPCYYVTGNHEFWTGRADAIMEMVRESGVTVLRGTGEVVDINGQRLRVCGVDDPDGLPADAWRAQLAACAAEDGAFTILLSHRPELAEIYAEKGFELVVAGHAHGGQARIPLLLNGLFAPNQGWFPKYAGGRYEVGDTVMIVSRGLQNWGLPRVFNPPELVVIDLVGA